MADSNMCDVASETNNAEDSCAIVTVLSKGNLIDYVIPSFPVYCAKLVEVKIQYQNENGHLTISDAFAKDCEEMNHSLPAFAKINYGYENACVIEVGFIQ